MVRSCQTAPESRKTNTDQGEGGGAALLGLHVSRRGMYSAVSASRRGYKMSMFNLQVGSCVERTAGPPPSNRNRNER
ncbi:hypothetical protein FQA47_011620 [Oryzias melastigma]|uniref:Uncharacterized protein n=1 Tax=Oryzias melastigma TaxID=30732 RepID=A0A834FF06_ORYME|nr:hypothetical protein FQA47_011620 [Oryzias melastigma]